jgi:hypothetical protein
VQHANAAGARGCPPHSSLLFPLRGGDQGVVDKLFNILIFSAQSYIQQGIVFNFKVRKVSNQVKKDCLQSKKLQQPFSFN